MKFILILFGIFTFSLNAIAQEGISMKNFKMISLKKRPKTEKTLAAALPEPSVFSQTLDEKPLFDKNQTAVPKFPTVQKSKLTLTPQNDFVNPNADLIDKLNHKTGGEVSEGFKVIRGNQDLGSFNSKAKFLNVQYRDFGDIDGDQIRIYVNGKIVESIIMLDGDFQGVQIDLVKGFNKIEFEALNQGTLGPNTAEFKVYDDNKKLVSSNLWNLATGFKASVMVIKE